MDENFEHLIGTSRTEGDITLTLHKIVKVDNDDGVNPWRLSGAEFWTATFMFSRPVQIDGRLKSGILVPFLFSDYFTPGGLQNVMAGLFERYVEGEGDDD